MVLFVQCVVICILFSLLILPGLYRDPLNMIMSYPPTIIKRVESLPQYRDRIKSREKKHISKKIVGTGISLVVALLSGGIVHLIGLI